VLDLDVFEIQCADILEVPGIEVRPTQTAFGPTSDRYVSIDGFRLGEIVDEASSGSGSIYHKRLGGISGKQWYVIEMKNAINEANDPVSWGELSRALELLLAKLGCWRVVCESDCEQHALVESVMTAPALLKEVSSFRTSDGSYGPIAIVASSSESMRGGAA